MGLNIKKIHGKEFLYFLYEKKSLLIGPKGEYEKGNLENVKTSIERNDSKIDAVLKKYLDDAMELTHYLSVQERKEYLSKRYAKLLAKIGSLKRQQQD